MLTSWLLTLSVCCVVCWFSGFSRSFVIKAAAWTAAGNDVDDESHKTAPKQQNRNDELKRSAELGYNEQAPAFSHTIHFCHENTDKGGFDAFILLIQM